MGVVYRALDHEAGHEVALKTLSRLDAAGLYRLKQEFRALADVVHPNLVRLHDLVAGDGTAFFTMELLDGVSFIEHVRPDLAGGTGAAPSADDNTDSWPPSGEKGLDLPRLKETLRQLATGVQALHRAGRLHCDIKSSNVMVTRDQRVVLLDFGLVSVALAGGASDGAYWPMAGTPSYMAPEQAEGRPPTDLSDWYAVGVMLFYALTGALPFTGAASEVLLRKRLGEAPAPLCPAGAEDLAQLCASLLRREPAHRPPVDTILRSLGVELERVAAFPGGESVFVGRANELGAMHEALDATRRGRPMLLRLHGPSGIGKTSLLQRFRGELRARGGAVVLNGRCHEREAVPYKTVDAVVDDLSHYLLGLSPAEVESLLPPDLKALARMFPVLERVEAVARSPRSGLEWAEPDQLRKRGFLALKRLLGSVAARQRLVICIDDVQWGDSDGARLIVELLRPPQAPALLLLMAHRAEIGERSPLRLLLSDLEGGDSLESRELPIGPLASDETEELAFRLLGSTKASAADSIAREANGNPYFVWELAEHLVRSDTKAAALADVVAARLQSVSEGARHLLDVIALAGRPLSPRVAAEASGARAEAPALLSSLCEASLVRRVGSKDEAVLETYHDCIREHAVARLGQARSVEIHGALARAIEASDVPDPEALAQHWEAAGDVSRAIHWTTEAARRATRGLALERASRLYRHTVELHRLAGAAVPAELVESCGDACLSAGLYDVALECFRERLQTLAGRLDRARVLRKTAEAILHQGHTIQGARKLEDVLRTLGSRVPRTLPTLALGVAWNTSRLVVHALFGRLFVRATRGPDSERQEMIAVTSALLVDAYYWNDMRRSVFHQFASVNAADRAGPARALVVVLANNGYAAAMFGFRGLGRMYSERARVMADTHGGPAERAIAAHMHAYADACAANAAEHARGSARALRVLRDDPDPYRLLYIEHSLAEAWIVQGHAEDARTLLDASLPLVEALDNDRLRAWRYWIRGHAAARLDEAEAERFLSKGLSCGQRSEDWLAVVEAASRLAFLAALAGRLDESLDLARRAARDNLSRALRHICTVADGVFLAVAALCLRAGRRLDPDDRRLARRILWTRGNYSRCLRYTRPLFLAGGAAWHVAHGRPSLARRSFRRSAAFAEAHGLGGELYDIHRLAAQVLDEGDPERNAHVRGAAELRTEAAMRRFEPPR